MPQTKFISSGLRSVIINISAIVVGLNVQLMYGDDCTDVTLRG